MEQMHRVVATVVVLGLGIVTLLLLGACTQSGAGQAAQVQAVDPAPTTAVLGGTPPPARTPNTPPPGIVISTPVVVVTPTLAGSPPTRDPRTPVVPTIPPITPSPIPTSRLLTPASSHTPGPTPTNPPGEEQLLRAAFTAGLQDRLARGRLNLDQTKVRAVISSVRIDGDWATIGIRLEYLTGGNVPTGGGLAMARKLNQQWQLAFPGDPEFRPWLEDMPDSLLTPQQRRMFY